MQRKYKVIRNIKDDNGYHNPGDIILMDDIQAEPLLAIGCIEAAVQDITPHPDTTPAASATNTSPATGHTMTAPQMGQPMTAAPSGASQPTPGEQTPPTITAETTPAAAENQPGVGEGVQTAPQTVPANPTEEQIARDMERVA